MPAKKKSAAPKGSAKTSASKKVTPKAATKKSTNSAGENGSSKSAQQKASEILKRKDHHTPNIFKISGARRSTPIVFTLEDVKELLKKRKAEDIPTLISKAPAKKTPPANNSEHTPQAASKHNAASLADILGFSISPSADSKKAPAVTQPVPKKWEHYHNLLCELRNHVRQSLGMHAEDTLKRSQKEDSGDISTSSDSGTDNFDRDFALSVVSSEQEAIREIEAAIQRIYKGTYGLCEITGETISEERLEAVPFTRYSLDGQRQHEQDMRYRIRRGGPTSSFLGDGTETVSFGDDDGDN